MEDSVKRSAAKRDEAIRKVAAFLQANYRDEWSRLRDADDELDEACSIVEIVESTAEYIRWEKPWKIQ